MQRVLDALAWLEEVGAPSPFPRPQVAAIAGYAPGAGNFRAILGRCAEAALVSYPAVGCVVLSPLGRSLAAPPGLVSAGDGLRAAVLARCDGPMGRCLVPVLDVFPDPIARAVVAEKAGYAGGAGNFRAIMGRLAARRFVEKAGPGLVVAARWIFVDGSP